MKTARRCLTFFFALIVCFSFSSISYADSNSPLILKADEVAFDRVSKNISATGNVFVYFKGNRISSETLFYSSHYRQFNIATPFSLVSQTNRIDGHSFFYNLDSYKGKAHDFDAKIDRFIIHGDIIDFSPTVVTILNASFTTCDLDEPHYKIKSSVLNIYPALGFMVAFNNNVTGSVFPFDLWVPTYIYGSTRYSILGPTNPLPQFGSSNREGFYIKEQLPYYLNSQSTGTFDTGYLWKLGWYYGFSHGFIFTDNHKVNIKAHSVGSDGVEGGLIYHFDLAKTKTTQADSLNSIENLFSSFSAGSTLPLSRVIVQYSFRELINDSRVDFAPLIHLDINRLETLPDLFLETQSNFGRITENRPDAIIHNVWRTYLNATLIRPLHFSDTIDLEAKLRYLGQWHDTGEIWERWFLGLHLGWDWEGWNPKLSFTKRLQNTGLSPFLYVRKYAIEKDELGFQMYKDIGNNKLFLNTAYNLEDKEYRIFDIAISFGLHRFNLQLGYQAVKGQFFIEGNI